MGLVTVMFVKYYVSKDKSLLTKITTVIELRNRMPIEYYKKNCLI